MTLPHGLMSWPCLPGMTVKQRAAWTSNAVSSGKKAGFGEIPFCIESWLPFHEQIHVTLVGRLLCHHSLLPLLCKRLASWLALHLASSSYGF